MLNLIGEFGSNCLEGWYLIYLNDFNFVLVVGKLKIVMLLEC